MKKPTHKKPDSAAADAERGLDSLRDGPEEAAVSGKRAILRPPKKSKRTRLQNREEYRLLFDANPCPMFVFDEKTLRFLKVNKAAVKHYGYSYDEFYRMTLDDIRPAEDIAAMHEAVRRQAGARALPAGQWRHRTRDGRIIIAELIVSELEYEGRQARLVLVNDITERRQTELKIRNLSMFPEENPFPVLRLSADGTILYSNRPGRCLLDTWNTDVGRKAPPDWCALVLKTLAAKQYQVEDIDCGRRKFSCALAPNADGNYVNVYGRDVTAQKTAETNQTLLTNVLQILNRGDAMQPLIRETLNLIQQVTEFDAVGLRMRQEDDYPYFEQNGFSREFLRHENVLCAKDDCGKLLRDPDGNPVLECTCGRVLSGKVDPSKPDCTEYGSFWTNDSAKHADVPVPVEPEQRLRKQCIHSGYRSIGLFPVKAGESIVGLLQLNDRRPDRFTPATITFYENLARNIGLTLQRTLAEEALLQARQELERRVEERTVQLKKATEAAEAERKRFNDVLETLPAYVCLLTPDYQIPFANRIFREWFDYQPGKRCHEFLFNRTEPCETFTVLKTGRPHHWEWTGPNDRTYDIYDFPFQDTDGSQMILEMGIDITVVRQAETALRELNETLERQVADRTESLRRSNAELTEFNNLMVDRELRMIELKKEINKLCLQSDQPVRYIVDEQEGTV